MGTSRYRTARYTARPPAAHRSARLAWDELSRRAALMNPPRSLQYIWHARDIECWTAYLNEIDANERSPFLDMDDGEVRDRRLNARRYSANDEARPSQAWDEIWALRLVMDPQLRQVRELELA